MPLPSEKEEIWRYSPIDAFDLDRYVPVGEEQRDRPIQSGRSSASWIAPEELAPGIVAVTANGWLQRVDRVEAPGSVVVRSALDLDASPPAFGAVLSDVDAFVCMNDAFHPGSVVLEVPAGVQMDAPIVVVHLVEPEGLDGAPAIFPRMTVEVGEGARARLVELLVARSDPGVALVVPVTELRVGEKGDLSYVAVQQLGTRTWHIARLCGEVEREGRLRTLTVGLGATYDRSRSDVTAKGEGAATELRSAYFGSDTQVHDVRTIQEHAAPRTTSDLLCKGAVAQESRSIYSGLIRIRHGATKSNAMQTNHNLVLDQRSHADSVPNLDIEENDVRCSHASSVGPIDEDQRYYIESRGVPPERAERLIVLGFFDDLIDRSPMPEAMTAVRRQIGERVVRALASRSAPPGDVCD